jgi:hypothetical protein
MKEPRKQRRQRRSRGRHPASPGSPLSYLFASLSAYEGSSGDTNPFVWENAVERPVPTKTRHATHAA